MPDFECRLKKYRLLKDLTQEQLAAQVGVRRETIMRLEKAQYNPSLKLAIDISRVVEAPIKKYSFSSDLCMYFDKFNNAPSFLCYGYDF